MYVLGESRIDSQGRTIIAELFGNQKPSEVVLAIDIDKEMIAIIPVSKAPDFGTKTPVDDKNRIVIPKWMRSQLGVNEVYLVYDNGTHYLSPKTGNLL